MPHNRFLHLGILVVVASALLWLGAQLTKRIEWALPYSAGLGVALLAIGLLVEWRRKQRDRRDDGTGAKEHDRHGK